MEVWWGVEGGRAAVGVEEEVGGWGPGVGGHFLGKSLEIFRSDGRGKLLG